MALKLPFYLFISLLALLHIPISTPLLCHTPGQGSNNSIAKIQIRVVFTRLFGLGVRRERLEKTVSEQDIIRRVWKWILGGFNK